MQIDILTADEARVLGTLLEKSMSTPDYYPMTFSALRTACNQKTCREPVSDLTEATLQTALTGLKSKTLVVFVPYGSSPGNYKFRHFLEDIRFDLFPRHLAVLSVLLLRGAQTVNEIKIRSASQFAFSDPAAVEVALQELAQRAVPLTEKIEKRSGWKEIRWRHCLYHYGEGELGWVSGSGLSSGLGSGGEDRMTFGTASSGENHEQHGGWREEMAALREDVAALRAELNQLKADLGV
jgi:uncharacterized protein